MDLSLRVMKEPRGFIRVIQCVMAVIAFSTTAGFSTECEFSVSCGNKDKTVLTVDYEFGYPFSRPVLSVPDKCEEDGNEMDLKLPFDFGNVAKFYVATGVLSFLYTIGILIVYIFCHQTYSNNTKIPVMDLGVSALLAIFWMAGSSAWAQGVADLKFYLHPETVFQFLCICVRDNEVNDCKTVENGSYGVLNASLVVGFGNFLLWASCLWFIYKETVFHNPEISTEDAQNQMPKSIGRPTDVRKV